MRKKLSKAYEAWGKKGATAFFVSLSCLSFISVFFAGFLELAPTPAAAAALTCLSPQGIATQGQGVAAQATASGLAGAAVATNVPTHDSATFAAINVGLLGQTIAATASLNSLAAKTCVQDGIFKQLAKIFINMLTKSIVNWINSGFQGGPTFVTDPAGFFENVANNEIGAFLQGEGLGFVCSPFKAQIQIALRQLYTPIPNYNGCTLTKIISNFTNFGNGFSQNGGWGGWIQMSTGNSPYNQFLTAQAQLSSRMSSPVNTALAKLNWGSGFFSIPDPTTGKLATPGTVIAHQIDTATDSNFASAELATSFDDIIYALLNQMTTQLLSPSGLLGGSSNSGYNAFAGSGENYVYMNLQGSGSGTVTDATGALNCSDATSTPTGTPNCYPSFTTGTVITLTAQPDWESSFDGWTGTASCSTSPTCQITMNSDQSITADFEPAAPTGATPTTPVPAGDETLTATLAGTGSGVVSSTDGQINCTTGSCTANYPQNTSVTLLATVGADSTFDGWSGACSGTAILCSVTMSDAQSATATFTSTLATPPPTTPPPTVATAEIQVGYNTSDTGFQAQVDSGAQNASVPAYFPSLTEGNHSVTMTMPANVAEYYAVTAGICQYAQGSSQCTPATYTTVPACNTTVCTISAVTTANTIISRVLFAFSRLNSNNSIQPITVSTNGNGSGWVESSDQRLNCSGGSCTDDFSQGTKVTLVATPTDSNSVFGGWSGACSGTNETCTVTASTPETVTATFNPATP